MIGYFDKVDAGRIIPIHGIRDHEKLETLTKSMESDGWVGRPILVTEARDVNGSIDSYYAVTGSHRIAAAEDAEMYDIPVYVLPDGYAWDKDLERYLHELCDDEDRLAALVLAGDETAIKLMQEELEQN